MGEKSGDCAGILLKVLQNIWSIMGITFLLHLNKFKNVEEILKRAKTNTKDE